MAIVITSECINCGACEPECPNTAIYEGGASWALAGKEYSYFMVFDKKAIDGAYTVEKAKKHGANIIYGDPSDPDILDYAQVEKATILIIAVPDRHSQEMIILNAKKLNSKLFIIGRVHKEADQIRMKDLGVDLVVQPEFEASLSIIRKIYLWHKIDKIEIVNKIKRLKIEHGLS